MAFSPDGRSLIAVGKDHSVRAWDAATGRPSGPPLVLDDRREDEWIGRVAFSPDGRMLATLDEEGHACFWDPSRGRRVGTR